MTNLILWIQKRIQTPLNEVPIGAKMIALLGLIAVLNTSSSHYDTVPLTYTEKADSLRVILGCLYSDADPFIQDALRDFGPKFILECRARGWNPAERFAQCLFESSKMTSNGRVWSNLTTKYNNFGGVKANKNADGKTPPLATKERRNGKTRTEYHRFAASETKWDGIEHYLNLLDRPRFASAKGLTGHAFFIKLGQLGYYTHSSKDYANQCMGLMERYNLHLLNTIVIPTEKEETRVSPGLIASLVYSGH